MNILTSSFSFYLFFNLIKIKSSNRFIYPEFLPNPVYYFRDKIKERLERQEMINRRKNINIPEFYVGTILAVTVSDLYAPGKMNRFVGICIRREGYGLRHSFTLRNVIENLGDYYSLKKKLLSSY